jgi:thioredoxin 1
MKIRILGIFIAVTLSLFGFAQGDIQNISAEEFNTQIEKNPGIILDVRTPAETAQGYIPDASFIDFYDPEFKAKVKLMQKDQPIYVYCRSGGRSAKAAKILIQSGFKEVYNLTGGIGAWNSAGFKVKKSSANTKSEKAALSPQGFQDIIKSEDVVLVDFNTPWCSPCKKMAPIVQNISTEFEGKARVLKVDVDKNKALAKSENVVGVPVLAIYKNGKEVWRKSGTFTQQELSFILHGYI